MAKELYAQPLAVPSNLRGGIITEKTDTKEGGGHTGFPGGACRGTPGGALYTMRCVLRVLRCVLRVLCSVVYSTFGRVHQITSVPPVDVTVSGVQLREEACLVPERSVEAVHDGVGDDPCRISTAPTARAR